MEAEYYVNFEGSLRDFLIVGPPFLGLDGPKEMGSNKIAKVEFLLFGFEMMTLLAPNRIDKYDIRQRYVFEIPSAFKNSPSYVCGAGKYLSEVRVTDVNGLVLSRTFEICQGVPLVVSAQTP